MLTALNKFRFSLIVTYLMLLILLILIDSESLWFGVLVSQVMFEFQIFNALLASNIFFRDVSVRKSLVVISTLFFSILLVPVFFKLSQRIDGLNFYLLVLFFVGGVMFKFFTTNLSVMNFLKSD